MRLPLSRCLLSLLWSLAVLGGAGCVGGQSGDEGVDFVKEDDGKVGIERAAAAPDFCSDLPVDDPAGLDAGAGSYCSRAMAGGFDCECAGEAKHSDALGCADALREECGVEPADAGPPPEDALPPPATP